jgi:hypothetical protein
LDKAQIAKLRQRGENFDSLVDRKLVLVENIDPATAQILLAGSVLLFATRQSCGSEGFKSKEVFC